MPPRPEVETARNATLEPSSAFAGSMFRVVDPERSEMARRVREFDWANTPLGPIECWSPALKWAVRLVLASGFPKAVRWGPELVLIYNDAYRPILADKHPEVLGKPLRQVWSEIYAQLGPLNEDILAGRRPAFFA
jgi:hypothetical protein